MQGFEQQLWGGEFEGLDFGLVPVAELRVRLPISLNVVQLVRFRAFLQELKYRTSVSEHSEETQITRVVKGYLR